MNMDDFRGLRDEFEAAVKEVEEAEKEELEEELEEEETEEAEEAEGAEEAEDTNLRAQGEGRVAAEMPATAVEEETEKEEALAGKLLETVSAEREREREREREKFVGVVRCRQLVRKRGVFHSKLQLEKGEVRRQGLRKEQERLPP